MIFEIFILLSLWLWSIVLHELGHYIILRVFGRKPEIRIRSDRIVVGHDYDYNGLTDKQLYLIYMSGVVLGLIPVVLIIKYYNLLISLVVLGFYIFVSRSDLKKIWSLRK